VFDSWYGSHIFGFAIGQGGDILGNMFAADSMTLRDKRSESLLSRISAEN
jgi:hypothetical protein